MSAGVPGNAPAIEGEVRRIRQLHGQLERVAEAFAGLDVERWTGRARDGFDGFSRLTVKRTRELSDVHDSAARLLASYHATLLHVQDRLRHTVLPAEQERLRTQLHEEAADVAAQLARLAPRLDQPTPQAPSEPVRPAQTGDATPDRRQPTAQPSRPEGIRYQNAVFTEDHLREGSGFDPSQRLGAVAAVLNTGTKLGGYPGGAGAGWG